MRLLKEISNEALYEDIKGNIIDASLTESEVIDVDPNKLTQLQRLQFQNKYEDILIKEAERMNAETLREYGLTYIEHVMEAQAMDFPVKFKDPKGQFIVIPDSSFLRAFKKWFRKTARSGTVDPGKALRRTLSVLSVSPMESGGPLRVHKLPMIGGVEDTWSIAVTGYKANRILYRVDKKTNTVILKDIGDHERVYSRRALAMEGVVKKVSRVC